MDNDLSLLWFLLAPLIGGLACCLLPSARVVRWTALAAAALPLLQGAFLLADFALHPGADLRHRCDIPWAPALGIGLRLGADGISAAMLALSGLVGVAAVIASRGIERRVGGYHALLLLLLAGTNGVFIALDGLLFYFCWEAMLVPMFVLIAVWGGEQRRYAATKFFLYTFGGSVLMLAALLALYFAAPAQGAWARLRPAEITEQFRDGMPPISDQAALDDANLPVSGRDLPLGSKALTLHGLPVHFQHGETLLPICVEQRGGALIWAGPDGQRPWKDCLAEIAKGQVWAFVPRDLDLTHQKLLWRNWQKSRLWGLPLALLGFLAFALAFAVKVPVMPLHTWLPHAHVQAPTAISVVLAGILLKLGVFGFIRLAYPIFPVAALSCGWWIAALGVLGIVGGAWIALMQTDLKRLVAYSSVSHMGWCMLGLAALTVPAVSGVAVQMFNHGTGSAMLFLLVGVLYDRAHHRRVDGFGGLNGRMPRFSALLLLAALAAAGLPGLSGFVGELLVVLGAAQSSALVHAGSGPDAMRCFAIIAVVAVILSAAYLLWMVKRVAYGPPNPACAAYADCTRRELAALLPLAACLLVFGVWPAPLLDAVRPACESLVDHVQWAAGQVAP